MIRHLIGLEFVSYVAVVDSKLGYIRIITGH